MGSVVATMWREERAVLEDDYGAAPDLRRWHVSPGARAASGCASALHLVDLENLCGGIRVPTSDAIAGLRTYLDTAGWRPDDHVVVAAHPALVIAVGFARLVPARLIPATGRDAADHALLDAIDAAAVARRYDRVVVGSGDHAFAPLVATLADVGVDIAVVARPASISHELFVHRCRLGLPVDAASRPAAPAPVHPLATEDLL